MRRPLTRKCARARAGFWDHVIVGSSALRSPLLTSFMTESAEALGLSWSLVLYDLTKFYDTIRLSALIGEAALQGDPLKVLVMLVGTYLAPRVLKEGDCCSAPLQPVDSILAGCGEANNMARAAL
jgi:hypothetical protein